MDAHPLRAWEAAIAETVRFAETAHFVEHPGDFLKGHGCVVAAHRPTMLADGGAAHHLNGHIYSQCTHHCSASFAVVLLTSPFKNERAAAPRRR